MGKKTSAFFYLALPFLCTPLFSVTKEKSSLDKIPLTTILREVAPKKLSNDNSLFSSYITFEDKIPLKKNNIGKKDSIAIKYNLDNTITSDEPFFSIKNKKRSKASLAKTDLGQHVHFFLNNSFIEKILSRKNDASCVLSSRAEREHLRKTLSQRLPSNTNNTFLQNLSPDLFNDSITTTSTTTFSESKTPLSPKETSYRAYSSQGYEDLKIKKSNTLPSLTKEEKKTKPLSIFSIALEDLDIENFSPQMKKEEMFLSTNTFIPLRIQLSARLAPCINKKHLGYKKNNYQNSSHPAYLPQTNILASKSVVVPNISIESTEQKQYPLSLHTIKETTITPLPIKHTKTSKHTFLENSVCINLSPKQISHQELQNKTSTNNLPAKESITTIHLPFSKVASLPKYSLYHPFSGKMKRTAYNKNFSTVEKAFFGKEDNIFSEFSKLENLPSKLQDVIVQLEKFEWQNKKSPFKANLEKSNTKEPVTIAFKRKQRIKKSKKINNFPLRHIEDNYQENITHIKLPKALPREESLSAEKNYPEFFEQASTSISFKKVHNKKNNKHFIAGKETQKTKYKSISSPKVESSIVFSPQHKNHKFKGKVKDVQLGKKILPAKDIASSEKLSLPVTHSSKIPTKKYFIQDIACSDKKYLQSQKPIQLDRIALQNHIPIQKTLFLQNISLPCSSYSKEANFYMHPMLNLFSKNSFALEDESRFVAIEANRSARMTGYMLFNWPTLEDLKTDSLSENFSLETRLLNSELSDENEFACTIRGDSLDILPSMPINILYILDGSKSIEGHRFELFKKAIIDSLDYIDIHSTFNIAVLHKGSIKKLRERNIHPTKSAKSFAKRFLRKMEQSSGPNFDQVISLVAKEKTLSKKDDSHRTCILLSDGNFAKNIRVNNGPLKALHEIDIGNFSLYTATASDKNNKQMLSLLAKLNHGFSLFTRTHASFPRKFSILVKKIRRPILQDITITFPDNNETIAYANDNIHPILHAGKSLTLFGASSKKERQKIFIQGKSGNRWVNILKELPLDTSRKGKYSLHKRLANQKTLFSIESFLKNGDETHLTDAKKFSEEYDIHTLVP